MGRGRPAHDRRPPLRRVLPLDARPGVAQPPPDPEVIRAQARDWVYQRLAFASAAIWAGLTAILYATFVPYIMHPQLYIAIASVVPLAPAALPWLFYRKLTDVRARWLLAQ